MFIMELNDFENCKKADSYVNACCLSGFYEVFVSGR